MGALIDTAAMAAAWATDEVPESVGRLDRRALGELRGCRERCRPPRGVAGGGHGGRLSFCEVRVTDPDGAVVAHGIATYRFG